MGLRNLTDNFLKYLLTEYLLSARHGWGLPHSFIVAASGQIVKNDSRRNLRRSSFVSPNSTGAGVGLGDTVNSHLGSTKIAYCSIIQNKDHMVYLLCVSTFLHGFYIGL